MKMIKMVELVVYYVHSQVCRYQLPGLILADPMRVQSLLAHFQCTLELIIRFMTNPIKLFISILFPIQRLGGRTGPCRFAHIEVVCLNVSVFLLLRLSPSDILLSQ